MEKCFCHLNGYKVKDADARAKITEIEAKIKNLPTGGGGAMYLHKLKIPHDTLPYGYLYVDIISSRSTPYTYDDIWNTGFKNHLYYKPIAIIPDMPDEDYNRKISGVIIPADEETWEDWIITPSVLCGDGSVIYLCIDGRRPLEDTVIEL